MALKLAEEQAIREEEEAKEEEANNPMKLLENRTQQSKNEIELLESLEELKDLNRRQQVVDYDTMLAAYDTTISEREREEKLQQLDEEYIKTIKFQSNQKRKVVVEEQIIESDEPTHKTLKTEEMPSTLNTTQTENSDIPKTIVSATKSTTAAPVNWNRSANKLGIKKNNLLGIVKVKKDDKNVINETKTSNEKSNLPETSSTNTASATTGLSLLLGYSDSDKSDSD